MAYKPRFPFNTAIKLLIPTETMKKGTAVKTFPDLKDAPVIYGSFRTFGGTDSNVNGVLSVVDTATIDTWYRPDITSACRLYVIQTGAYYEIIAKPENIEMRNKWLKIRVKGLAGGA